MENSAATKKPFANTSAHSPASRHRVAANDASIRNLREGTVTESLVGWRSVGWFACDSSNHKDHTAHQAILCALCVFVVPEMRLRLAVREEVRVHEIVDERLVCGIDGLELNAHADAAFVPGDASFGVDVVLRS